MACKPCWVHLQYARNSEHADSLRIDAPPSLMIHSPVRIMFRDAKGYRKVGVQPRGTISKVPEQHGAWATCCALRRDMDPDMADILQKEYQVAACASPASLQLDFTKHVLFRRITGMTHKCTGRRRQMPVLQVTTSCKEG